MAKLSKTWHSIGSVKHKFYPWLAMLAAFCLLMWTLLKVALPAYAEVRSQLREKLLAYILQEEGKTPEIRPAT